MRPMYQTQQYRSDDTGHFVAGVIAFLVVVAIVFGFVVLLTKYAQKQAAVTGEQTTDPLDIIKLRYAKGEITKDEFEQLKKDLK